MAGSATEVQNRHQFKFKIIAMIIRTDREVAKLISKAFIICDTNTQPGHDWSD